MKPGGTVNETDEDEMIIDGDEQSLDGDTMPPAQMMGAPTWAQYLFAEQRRESKNARRRDMLLGRRMYLIEKTVSAIDVRLGAEAPDGDGGTGFVGETRRNTQDIDSLKGERNFVRGAIAAITAAGTLLVYGFTAWIKNAIQGGNHNGH